MLIKWNTFGRSLGVVGDFLKLNLILGSLGAAQQLSTPELIQRVNVIRQLDYIYIENMPAHGLSIFLDYRKCS